jgi:alpha-N-arabinofuranosidase
MTLVRDAPQYAPKCLPMDAGSLGPEISPWIYGQFIEHLDRCIYGGIWAEMLKDRKFFRPIGHDWHPVHPDRTVFEAVLDPGGAFAGTPCMALWVHGLGGPPRGIRQSGLRLRAGQTYAGYAWLANIGAPASVQVRLAWGDDLGQTISLKAVGPSYARFEFSFTAGADTADGAFELTVQAPCHLWIGCVSLMPADHVDGMRADTLALIRELAPPVVRWPGGNFVSGYCWKDGLGPRDRRPPRWDRAWKAVEPNDFGIDEFLHFCRLIDTEPYIALNAGLGSLQEAGEELEYCNGSPSSRWGGERARNGHRRPYRVKLWGIGNEMYGDWQLGQIAVQRYAIRHNAFAAALKTVDPSIQLVAVGAPGEWDQVALDHCASQSDMWSGHFYHLRKRRLPFSEADQRLYRKKFAVYSAGLARGLEEIIDPFVAWKEQHPGPLVLAIDEWGIVRDWDASPDGYGIAKSEHFYCLGDAITVARGLHSMLRRADVVKMANWAQTVNVIGAIKTNDTEACMDAAGWVLVLYRRHFERCLLPLPPAPAGLDWVAARSLDGRHLTLAVINWSPDDPASVACDFGGTFQPTVNEGWRVEGPALDSTNVPGQPEQVILRSLGKLFPGPLTLPPHSISLYRFSGRSGVQALGRHFSGS